MQQHDEAARRERQRAAGMRRWPSSLFLADQQYFRILESPELNRCEFSEAVRIHPFFDGNGRTARLGHRRTAGLWLQAHLHLLNIFVSPSVHAAIQIIVSGRRGGGGGREGGGGGTIIRVHH
ncbi:hypothetical protein niasHT_003059 [Heterodera trifolii]|uniref:Fido domain-containing protein n=1 Tax=Heterodera trifolii TaxID=157864 RepID=A0ABD2M4U0_9BILA